MAEILDQFGATIPETQEIGVPAVIIPQPFSLETQDKDHLDKLKDEVLDKVSMWENNFEQFFGEYQEMANAWRMIPQNRVRRPKGLSNTRVGETHRAVETLATTEFSMLTAADPYIEARPFGLDESGKELLPEDLFAIVQVLMRQNEVLKFEKRLLRGTRSKKLFGAMIVECPYVSLPYGKPQPYFEGTELVPRSLLQTGFDPYVMDIDMSDYIFTIDYHTKWRLNALASNTEEVWNKSLVDSAVKASEFSENQEGRFKTNVWNRIIERKQRAGYTFSKLNVHELISYHGKIDTSNPVIQNYWESMGRTDDPKMVDFTLGVLNADTVPRLHVTPYGTWHHIFKVNVANEFELEPMPYGVGKLGRELQQRLDTTQNRSNDLLKMALFGMWKLGKYSGFKANQFNIKPLNIIELEDISQFEPIRPDTNAIGFAEQMNEVLRTDFRQVTKATANLQAELTKASASESIIAQKEAIRSVSVDARIAAGFIRDFFETAHINNTDLLDYSIAVAMTGRFSGIMRDFDRNNLPRNIGFKVRTTTDRDFTPVRIDNLFKLLQLLLSVRSNPPSEINPIPYIEEISYGLGINPMRLYQKRPVLNQILDNIRRQQMVGGGGQGGIGGSVANENASEVASAGTEEFEMTPLGEVPTSPVADIVENVA